jgi:hypothetical protein
VAVTKVLVTIPLTLYRVLEQRCKIKSLEFRILKNGLIAEDKTAVDIRCESEQAIVVIAWANNYCRDAAQQINVTPEPD